MIILPRRIYMQKLYGVHQLFIVHTSLHGWWPGLNSVNHFIDISLLTKKEIKIHKIQLATWVVEGVFPFPKDQPDVEESFEHNPWRSNRRG